MAKLARPQIKPKAKLSLGGLASKVKEQAETRTLPEESVVFDEDVNPYATISEKIQHIEAILAAEDLPVARLKAGLKDVMTCLQDNEDDIMALQPAEISKIVAGYLALASEEERRIVEGVKPKAKRKTTKSAALKRIEKLDIDIDEVEF